MDRKDFLKTCGFACLGGPALASLLQSCETTKMLSGKIQDADLIVQVSDFLVKKDGSSGFKKFIVVQNEILQYPVCVFRLSDTGYSALFMRCSHQGAELQVFGDKLQCPAHGSEFTNRGDVQSGPADAALRTFPVTIEGNQLKISLK